MSLMKAQTLFSYRSRPQLVLVVEALFTLMLVLASTTAGAGIRSQNLRPTELADMIVEYDRATIMKDATTLSRIVADDFMLVNSDGSVQDKISYLADFRNPDFLIEPYHLEQSFTRLGGNTALTGGIFTLNWTQDGHRQSRRLRIVHYWTFQLQRWRIAYTQLTRVTN